MKPFESVQTEAMILEKGNLFTFYSQDWEDLMGWGWCGGIGSKAWDLPMGSLKVALHEAVAFCATAPDFL